MSKIYLITEKWKHCWTRKLQIFKNTQWIKNTCITSSMMREKGTYWITKWICRLAWRSATSFCFEGTKKYWEKCMHVVQVWCLFKKKKQKTLPPKFQSCRQIHCELQRLKETISWSFKIWASKPCVIIFGCFMVNCGHIWTKLWTIIS